MAIPAVVRALSVGTKGRKDEGLKLEATIDTRQLRALAARVEKLGHNNIHVQAGLNKIAVRWVAKIRLNFRNSVDPYGNTWEPIKHRKGQPLIDTGALRDSIDGSVKNTDITLSTNISYASMHNYGLGRIKRTFLPDDRGLPRDWEAEYVKIMEASVLKALS